jgi:hypothetical protein
MNIYNCCILHTYRRKLVTGTTCTCWLVCYVLLFVADLRCPNLGQCSPDLWDGILHDPRLKNVSLAYSHGVLVSETLTVVLGAGKYAGCFLYMSQM